MTRREPAPAARVPVGYDPAFPPPPPRPAFGATLWRMLVWLLRLDPPRVMGALAGGVVQGLCPAATVWIAARAFEDALGVYRGAVAAADLLRWLGAWGAVGLVSRGVVPLLQIPFERLHQEMEDAVQASLQRKAGRLRLEVFERSDFSAILGRAAEAADPKLMIQLILGALHLPENAITLAALAALLGGWNPWLLAAVAVTGAAGPLVDVLQSRARFLNRRALTAEHRLRDYCAEVLTSRAAAKEVRTFGLAHWLLGRWEDLYWEAADRIHRLERLQALFRAGVGSLSTLGVMAGLAFGAWAAATGALPAGRFAALILALESVQVAVVNMLSVFSHMADRAMRMADLFVYLDLGPEEPEGGSPPERGLGAIVLDGASFRYPQRPEAALQDISVTIRAGERVALVGENGSGKTTLVKVMLGLFRPSAGRVLYGGRDLWALDLSAVRDQQAAVFQDHVHYAFTLGENIGYGRAERMADAEAVGRAAERGGADEVARALPEGYGTRLTRLFSGGTELSGGQWQRVAVSRGFMRDGPEAGSRRPEGASGGDLCREAPGWRQAERPLIVLDEPTAALDPQAEADVFRRFAAMAGGRTAVLVSHRLGSARLCDRVLVLRGGRLVEQGTHEQLLATGGEYARMWALQAQWYR